MALVPPAATIQVVNVDLVPERQKILREKLRDLFKNLSRKSRAGRRELVYTVNADNVDLNHVLRANPGADALLTGFNYDAVHSEDYKQDLAIDATFDISSVPPELRYPIIADYRRHIDQGAFRHRKLVLVGDILDKLEHVLRSELPVRVSYFANEQRTEVTPPAALIALEGPGAPPAGFDVAKVHRLWIADIKFDGIINMPEEKNRFVLKDTSIVNTIRLLFTMEGVREVMTREFLQEEKLTFVRGKRVFILLDADLEHIISDRLRFDQMHQRQVHHTLEEALHTLNTGRSQSILDYFETNGYEVVFDGLTQEERDKFLVAVLGDKLGAMLDKELQGQKSSLLAMDEADLQSVLYNLPEPVLNGLLDGVKDKAYEKFLSLVPAKIRETVILSFLGDVKYLGAAWAGIGAKEQEELLTTQAPQVLAALNLISDKLFKSKFAALPFEFSKNYSSASLANMSQDEQRGALALFTKSLQKANIPPGVVAQQLSAQEIERVVRAYIGLQPAEFYNRLNPVVRKQLWITVAKEYKDHIGQSLHFLDKAEILKGNKELTLTLLFSSPAFVEHMSDPENRRMAAALYLIVKKSNKAESKTAMLKKVLSADEWKANRRTGVPDMLEDPENQALYQKLAEQVESLDFSFDSVICTRAHYERIKDKPPVANAVAILVDDMVDASLFRLFEKGQLSKDEYNRFSRSVEDEIAALHKKMQEQETKDPVGVYLLESMQVLHEISNQAVAGRLRPDMLQQLDERRHVRQRLVDALILQLKKIDDFLAKADGLAGQVEQKLQQALAQQEAQSGAYDGAYAKARAAMAELQKLQQALAQAQADRKKVALTQKELSLQFFRIIEPLILEKVKSLGSPMAALMKALGFGRDGPDVSGRRVIFKFSDEEIKNILRYNIVFCTKDDILMQFIVTCLRIDNLQDSLFSLGTLENLPKQGIDILFYGPGYTLEDFLGHVKENRIVSFADETFINRLLANEKLKARTKAVLLKAGGEGKTRKSALDAATVTLKEQQLRQGELTRSIDQLKQEQVKLKLKLTRQQEQQHHLQGEQELLESRLAEVDAQFDQIKTQVADLMPAGVAGTLEEIGEGQSGLAEKLGADLMEVNKQLARLMYIKGVKDVGDQISKHTQAGILAKMEQREIYSFKERPFKKLMVADDGAVRSKNIKRVFVQVASQYFKISDMVIEDITVKRLDGRAENSSSADYPFIVIITDKPDDHFAELRRIVKKVRTNMPETFQLVIVPFGEAWKYPPDSADLRHLRSLKDNSALVNSAIFDLQEPQAMLRLLAEKAQLNQAAPAQAPAAQAPPS